MSARILFMGTPDFAVPVLRALVESGHTLVGVVTQPDRPAGRGRALLASPVKRYAQSQGLDVWQPTTLRAPAAVAEIAARRPDVIVVAAFGMILRADVLALPPHGCLNVHASLLPRHRGASPIAAAILAGDTVTGCTIMRMDEGVDTGPILAQATLDVRPDDTAASLGERLAALGADLLVAALPMWLEGAILAQPQPAAGATVCRPIRKEEGQIDWSLPAVVIERMVRAYTPWPGAFTFWEGQLLKITRARVTEGVAEPGRVLAYGGVAGAAVGTGEGLLILEEVQPAGRRPLPIRDFLAGRRSFLGAQLGS